MIKKIKAALLALAAIATVSMPVLVPATVFAQEDNISGGLRCGANLDPKSLDSGGDTNCQINEVEASEKVENMIKLIINIFSLIVGVVSVIMIIIGGLKYVTSGGDAGNVTSAKNTIMFAIIGLVVVSLAQFAVRFVLTRVTAQT